METLEQVMAAALAESKARWAVRMAHRETCSVRPCKDCGLATCIGCGKDADWEGYGRAECAACEPHLSRERALSEPLRNIPPRYRDARFDDAGAQARCLDAVAWTKARAYADALASSVVLLGDAGAGKTTLAVAMLRSVIDAALDPKIDYCTEVYQRARGARFVTASALSRARSESPLGEECELVTEAMYASVLVIDDIGNEEDRYASALRDVINHRHDHERPTWVTTYLDPAGAQARYGGGIERRLFEARNVIRVKRG